MDGIEPGQEDERCEHRRQYRPGKAGEGGGIQKVGHQSGGQERQGEDIQLQAEAEGGSAGFSRIPGGLCAALFHILPRPTITSKVGMLPFRLDNLV